MGLGDDVIIQYANHGFCVPSAIFCLRVKGHFFDSAIGLRLNTAI